MRSLNSANAPWSLTRGATVLPDGSVRFSVWAPNAHRVAVRILDGEAAGEHELERVTPTLYEGIVAGTAAARADDASCPTP
jgi:1,4-alpha-glucan branching enzyme